MFEGLILRHPVKDLTEKRERPRGLEHSSGHDEKKTGHPYVISPTSSSPMSRRLLHCLAIKGKLVSEV